MSGCFLKKFDQWAEEEDEHLMKYYDKLYGPLLRLTAVFPSYKRSYLGKTLAIFGFYFMSLVYHFFVLMVSVFKLKDNFTLASLVFHFWLIFFFVMASMFFMNTVRSDLAQAHRIMAADLAQYSSGRIYDDDIPQKLEKEKRKELLKFLILPGLVVLIATAVLVVPYLKKLSQEKEAGDSHYTETGVNLNLPIALYYPFPTHSGIMHGVAVLTQAVSAGALAGVLVALEMMLFMVSHAIIFDYKVLQYGIESIFIRAKTLREQIYPLEKFVGGKSDFKYQRCIQQCFKDCVKHHHRIGELVIAYEKCIKWPVAMAYGIGTAVIGLSLVNILNAKTNGDFENMILFFLLLLVETLNMYIISVFGESITTESKVLRDVLYSIDWDELDVQNRKMMLNFQTGISNPVIVRAGGLVALCMDTFSSIMNTAYSFFNLMNAS